MKRKLTRPRRTASGAGVIFVLLLLIPLAYGGYEEDLRYQIDQVKRRYPETLDFNYFYDLGIIARKADEAQLNDLTTEIVGSLLLKPMDEFIRVELDEINRLFAVDSFQAARKLEELNRVDRYYQPTDEYLSTTGGQAFSGELARARQNALAMSAQGCSENIIEQALKALRKSGLFITNKTEEIRNTRELLNVLECCLNWKANIDYYYEAPFESEYEAGTLSEEGHLKLQSSPKDWTRAKWTGEWIYRFKGREGTAQGVSQAHLSYQKGDQPAELKISSSRVTSVGRINFPMTLAGDFRSLEVEGSRIHPMAIMPGQYQFALAGCRDFSQSQGTNEE